MNQATDDSTGPDTATTGIDAIAPGALSHDRTLASSNPSSDTPSISSRPWAQNFIDPMDTQSDRLLTPIQLDGQGSIPPTSLSDDFAIDADPPTAHDFIGSQASEHSNRHAPGMTCPSAFSMPQMSNRNAPSADFDFPYLHESSHPMDMRTRVVPPNTSIPPNSLPRTTRLSTDPLICGSSSREDSRCLRSSLQNSGMTSSDSVRDVSSPSTKGRGQPSRAIFNPSQQQQMHGVKSKSNSQSLKFPPTERGSLTRHIRRSTMTTIPDEDFSISSDAESDIDRYKSGLWRHLIHTGCDKGHLRLVDTLLQSGVSIEKRDSAGNTPLHTAAAAGHEEVMIFLLEQGSDVNAVNDNGWTAIHLSTERGHEGCLKVLLELNASPWARLTR